MAMVALFILIMGLAVSGVAMTMRSRFEGGQEGLQEQLAWAQVLVHSPTRASQLTLRSC